jgi:hypothetical protein
MAAKKSNSVPRAKRAPIKDLDLNKAKGKAAVCNPKGGGETTKLNLGNQPELPDGYPFKH